MMELLERIAMILVCVFVLYMFILFCAQLMIMGACNGVGAVTDWRGNCVWTDGTIKSVLEVYS